MKTKQKILIVDDKPENIFSLKKVLEDVDAEILEAQTGNDALIASLNHELALAILDIQMPEMNGYELAEFLRFEEKTKGIPIIFVSAVYSSDYHVFKGYEAGAVDFLLKPFDAKILLCKVNIFLELDRQRKALAASKKHIEKQLNALNASENRFKSLVETIPDIVYRINTDGCFSFVNNAVKRLGYEPDELLGRHFSYLINPADLARVSRESAVNRYNAGSQKEHLKMFDERRTRDRKTTGLEVRLMPKKGALHLTASLEQISDESIVVEINSAGLYSNEAENKNKIHLGTVGVIRDITQRMALEDDLRKTKEKLEKRVAERTRELMEKNRELRAEIELRKTAEQTVQQTQKQWEEIFEAVGHMAVVTDDQHTIIAANRSAVKQTGIAKAQLLGLKCHEIFHELKAPVMNCPLEKGSGKKEFQSTEMVVDTSGKTFICNITPVFEGKDNVTKFIHIFTDITRRTVLEKELLQAHKMEAIGTLAGGIAHDFNNILSALIGFSQLALKNAEKDSLMEEDLTEVLSCGLRAKELVRQILTFARQSDEEYAYIHLDYIVKEVSKFMRSTIPSSIDLKTLVQSTCIVFANATQIHQVLMNLCTNSAHAMKANGGVLGISLTDVSLDQAEAESIQNLVPGNYVKLEVSDTGTGIPPGVMGKMFEPYFTTKDHGEGTGMGLAVVQGIVKDIGGTIHVQTELGKGSIFTIFIPVADDSDPHPLEEEPEYKSCGSENILIVDDEPPITKVEQRMLEKAGYHVTIAETPCNALELFKENPHRFDLVITDLTMPGMTGDKLIQKILEIRPDLPAILCSGYQNRLVVDAETKNIWKAFVQKPIEEEVLIRTVKMVFDENTGR
ncbi:response regulator [uncultured Desulfobacter sp.]|uniref:response regulator n=1 Tax=uncultured Desulfobacter sp. TaxID=240139 RepID=UPI002AAB36B3|nr:response regulator [uncultured Desulfobacter sp.]